MSNTEIRRPLVALLVVLTLLLAACGGDDGASVREIGTEDGASTSGSASGSASQPASGSASQPADGAASQPADGAASSPASEGAASEDASADGGYDYASDVSAHRLVVQDVCDIAALLEADTIDYDAVSAIYAEGVHSVNDDGSVRSLGGFATAEDRLHGVDAAFDSATPLDDFVTDAIAGEATFAGASDEVRTQGIAKGVQNQIMVAWTVHELNSAIAKAEEGDFDAAEGAPHNWDEAWAFYHGAAPDCAPYATADKRAENFGTADADGTAQANTAILSAMDQGRDALLAEDVDGAQAAREEILRNLVITYAQATIRYAQVAADDVAAGEEEDAAVHQAEGLSFFRVLRPLLVGTDADLDVIDGIYDLSAEPGSGGADQVRAALQPALDELGIDEDEIGTLG